MDATQISALTPGGPANPIEVKIIRQWIPFARGKRNERYYLFVDKHGDAVEAVEALTNLQDRAHLESTLEIQSYYRVTEYICERAKPVMQTVPHSVTLRIGKAAIFVKIPDIGFPSTYFNFVTYEKLYTRVNKHEILTDYIGKVATHANNFREQSDPSRLKIDLEDPSGSFIEVTLWQEISTTFDKEPVKLAKPPAILAFTSMKVTEFGGKLQLGSTAGTYIYLNPDIEETKYLKDRFKDATPETTITQFDSKSDAVEIESEKNRMTITDLLHEDPQRNFVKILQSDIDLSTIIFGFL